jgi:hypothetical protein
MGLRPFVATEIESFVAGIRISLRLSHVYEALRLPRGGLSLISPDSVDESVDNYLFKSEPNAKKKPEWTNENKIIYKIFSDSILCKIGSTDQISDLQKLFTFHVSKGNFVDVAKILFHHLADSITSKKPIVRHARMLSHMFAQSGLMDAVKPFFPGCGNFLTSSKIINSTTLRYFKMVKNSDIVTPSHPVLIRESEEHIGECRLVHVSDRNARKVAEDHAKFLKSLGAEVGSGEVQELTIRQKRMLAPASKVVPEKRKAVKSPGPAVSKKAKTQAAPKAKTAKKPKQRKLILTDVTEEEKEQAGMAEALRLVDEQNKKEKLLKDTYESGVDPEVFAEMYEKIPPREKPLDPSQTIYGIFNGKTPYILVHNHRSLDVFRKNHFPQLVKVKRVFDRIFQGVNSLEESNLSENQPTSNPFNSIMYIPSESNI